MYLLLNLLSQCSLAPSGYPGILLQLQYLPFLDFEHAAFHDDGFGGWGNWGFPMVLKRTEYLDK